VASDALAVVKDAQADPAVQVDEKTLVAGLVSGIEDMAKRAYLVGEIEIQNAKDRFENYRHPGTADGDEGRLAAVQPIDANKGA
jgi:hypothetical protein